MQQPKKFATFCANCGSYDIEIYCTISETIVFECNNCEMKEVIE